MLHVYNYCLRNWKTFFFSFLFQELPVIATTACRMEKHLTIFLDSLHIFNQYISSSSVLIQQTSEDIYLRKNESKRKLPKDEIHSAKLQIKVNGLENFIIAIRDFYNFNFAPRTFLFLPLRAVLPPTTQPFVSQKGENFVVRSPILAWTKKNEINFQMNFLSKGKKEKVEKFHLIEFQR